MSSISEVMTPEPVCLDKDAPVRDAARVMRDENIGNVVITAGERVYGILTDRDHIPAMWMVRLSMRYTYVIGCVLSIFTAARTPRPFSCRHSIRWILARRFPVAVTWCIDD